MIKIITVGFIKEKYLQEAIVEYKKRISKYTNLGIIEVKDEGLVEEKKALELEATKIEKHLGDREYIITMEIDGNEYSSPEFAEKIRKTLIENSNITFIIGGSYGLADSIKNRANLHLSFSKLTFPHQLFRVILLEQIYRVYKINNNESYHK